MSKSCLKVRCPACKGRTRLTSEEFAELRRHPTVAIDHECEHCTRRFPTLLAGSSIGGEATPTPPSPQSPPTPLPMAMQMEPPLSARRPEPVPPAPAEPVVQAAPVAFPPKSEAPSGAPPFGLLGERRDENPQKNRPESPMPAPPPFAAGATAAGAVDGKKSLNEWWKSQSPGRQWTMLACLVVTAGAIIVSMPSNEASASGNGKTEKKSGKKSGKKSAKGETEEVAKEVPEIKIETVETEAAKNSVMTEKSLPIPVGADEAMGLLCQESTTLVGKTERPLAAVWAVEGKGFVARGAKVYADLHNSKGSTSGWFIQTPTKRYKVAGVKFHPDFPAAKLNELAAKGSQAEMVKLVQNAERSDLAMIETVETPAATLKLAKDLAEVDSKSLEVSTPVDPKAGKTVTVKFSRQHLAADMMTEQGDGLKLALAPGVDAAVVTKAGAFVAFIPRKNAADAKTAVHTIIPAETVGGLMK